MYIKLPYILSFPTRRSSDLDEKHLTTVNNLLIRIFHAAQFPITHISLSTHESNFGDRKSTRLNSSHRTISYSVFFLKKKRSMANNKYFQIYISTIIFVNAH